MRDLFSFLTQDFGGDSQVMSRLPSDENLCLSPPWNEEEDGAVTEEDKDVLVDQKVRVIFVLLRLYTCSSNNGNKNESMEITISQWK